MGSNDKDGYPKWAVDILDRQAQNKQDVLERLSEVKEDTAVQSEQISKLSDSFAGLPCEERGETMATMRREMDIRMEGCKAHVEVTAALKKEVASAKKWNRFLALIGGVLATLAGWLGFKGNAGIG